MFRLFSGSSPWCSVLYLSAAVLAGGCGQSSTEGAAGAAASAGSESTPVVGDTITPEERQAVEAFYRSKTVRIVVGSGAGGGFDTTARLVARHLTKHIPGQPTVIVENMPGGGGLVAANHMFYAAPKDGTVIGIFHESQVFNQWTQMPGVQFDLRQFNWLGSSYDDPNVCIVRTDAPFDSFKQLIGSDAPMAVGGTGPGSNTYDVPRVLAATTGANLKSVPGYPTSNDVRIGMERGELHGICFGWESVRSTAAQWLESKYVQVIVQNGSTPHPDLPDVPLAQEFAKDEESRTLLRLVDAPGAMAKPFAVPPGVDPARVRALRSALAATFQDPTFQQEANVLHLVFQPKTAAEIQQILDDVLHAPPEYAAKYKKIIEPES
jgi:tripartite-type tricarboxylate transporter receptor subunit TctC